MKDLERLEKLDMFCKKLGLKEYDCRSLNEKLSVLYKGNEFNKANELKEFRVNELKEEINRIINN